MLKQEREMDERFNMSRNISIRLKRGSWNMPAVSSSLKPELSMTPVRIPHARSGRIQEERQSRGPRWKRLIPHQSRDKGALNEDDSSQSDTDLA